MRSIEILRAAWGAALLCAPRPVLEQVNHASVDATSLAVARILGARHLAQAVLSGLSPTPEVLAMGVWVDAVHAGTAAALVVVDPARSRAGIADAAVAATWAGLGYRDLATARTTTTGHEHRRNQLARWALGWLPAGGGLRRRAAAART